MRHPVKSYHRAPHLFLGLVQKQDELQRHQQSIRQGLRHLQTNYIHIVLQNYCFTLSRQKCSGFHPNTSLIFLLHSRVWYPSIGLRISVTSGKPCFISSALVRVVQLSSAAIFSTCTPRPSFSIARRQAVAMSLASM